MLRPSTFFFFFVLPETTLTDHEFENSDYEGIRQGNRAVSLGEVPYFDPASISRREALAQQ